MRHVFSLSFVVLYASLVIGLLSSSFEANETIEDITPFRYCSKVNKLPERRRIPPLSENDSDVKLVHVQTLLRHGARTPVFGAHNCWEGFVRQWECDVHEDITGHVDNGFSTFTFHTVYDAQPWAQPLQNRCAEEQLTNEGVEQHKITGEEAAKAYFTKGTEYADLFHKEAEDGKNLDSLIYFRASEFQRTRLSGATFLTSMLEKINPKLKNPSVTMHTMGRTEETLIPNSKLCPALASTLDAANAYVDSKADLGAREIAKRVWDISAIPSNSWPMTPLDCLYTTICSNNPLPPKWSVGDVDRMLTAATEDFASLWSYKDGYPSKLVTARLFADLKTFVMRAMPEHINKFFENTEDQENHVKFMEEQTHIASPKRFVLWSGHDTTVLPFLAVFGSNMIQHSGIKGDRFPSYASMINFEYYTSSDEPLFRLIYNSKVLTEFVPGCSSGKELCPIKTLFAALSWVAPNSAYNLCSLPDTINESLRKVKIKKTHQLQA